MQSALPSRSFWNNCFPLAWIKSFCWPTDIIQNNNNKNSKLFARCHLCPIVGVWPGAVEGAGWLFRAGRHRHLHHTQDGRHDLCQVSYTVRTINCMMLSSMWRNYQPFPAFDENLRHIELCNSVISHYSEGCQNFSYSALGSGYCHRIFRIS